MLLHRSVSVEWIALRLRMGTCGHLTDLPYWQVFTKTRAPTRSEIVFTLSSRWAGLDSSRQEEQIVTVW